MNVLEMIALTSDGPRVCESVALIGTKTGLVFRGMFRTTKDLYVLGMVVRKDDFVHETLTTNTTNFVPAGDAGYVDYKLEIL